MERNQQLPSAPREVRRQKARVQNSRIVGWIHRALGCVLGLAGWGLLRSGRAVLPGFVHEQWGRAAAGAAAAVLGAAVISLGGLLLVRSRRHFTTLLSSFDRASEEHGVVLYLRAFSNDRDFARTHRGSNQPTALGMARRWTEEEEIADAVFPFGNMVSMGSPEDDLAHAGSARLYASDESWKDEVRAGLERASLVLLACGTGSGLQWEVEQVRDWNRPDRLVLVVGGDAVEYQSFKDAMEGFFPAGLPKRDPPADLPDCATDHFTRSIVWFEDDWTPHMVHLGARRKRRRSLLRTAYSPRWLSNEFARAIAPVHKRAGR